LVCSIDLPLCIIHFTIFKPYVAGFFRDFLYIVSLFLFNKSFINPYLKTSILKRRYKTKMEININSPNKDKKIKYEKNSVSFNSVNPPPVYALIGHLYFSLFHTKTLGCAWICICILHTLLTLQIIQQFDLILLIQLITHN